MNISEFHHILIFYISRGSVATQLKCREKDDSGHIVNSLLNRKVEKFFKSANIWPIYELIILSVFIDSV